MTTQPPILDDRDLKTILKQLRELANTNVAEWTPPVEGEDAGTMLHRIYARLLELVLQRLNQVPEKNLLAFLDTMGVSLLPPAPAKVPLTFTLTSGSPPILVPQGSQAGNQAIEPQPALLFETEEDFTVIPAQITQAFTIDPTHDRYADQTEAIAGSEIAFTPFVGTKHLPHILYLGDDILLDFRNGATVTVTFNWESDRPATEVRQLFQRLSYWYQSQGNIKLATLNNIIDSAPNQIQLKFSILDLLDQEIIQGVGFAQRTLSRWFRADLTTPIQDNLIAQTLQLSSMNVKVDATNLLPDLAFTNNTPLDVTKDFLPFGETPKIGDTFYLASTEALSKVEPRKGSEGGQITINVTFKGAVDITFMDADNVTFIDTEVKLRWRYCVLLPPENQGPRWIEFTPEDGTKSFTQSGSIGFPDFQAEIDFPFNGDISGFFIEVTIIDGNYQHAPLIESGYLEISSVGVFSVELEPYTKEFSLDAVPSVPVSEDRRFKRINSSNFFPFGRVPRVGNSFFFVSPTRSEEGDTVSAILEFITAPPVQLVWEYWGLRGWIRLNLSDNFGAFNPDIPQSGFRPATLTSSGIVRFKRPSDFIPALVHGETNFWIRVRFIGGSYGRSNEFVPIDASDLRKGYQQLPDTLDIFRSSLQRLTFNYESERIPTVATQNSFLHTDQTEANQKTKFAPFVSAQDLIPIQYADPNPAFYLGFDAAFPQQPVRLYGDVSPRSFSGSREQKNSDSSSSALPTLQWQYFNGTDWLELAVFDRTNNLTESGTVDFLTPPDIVKLTKFDLREQYWIRAQSPRENPLKAPPNNPSNTQQLRGVYLNTTPAIQAVAVASAILGSGNGLPNQTLRFTRVPVLPRQQVLVQEPEPPSDREQVALETEEGKDAIQTRLNSVTREPEIWVRWHEVPNFTGSDPTSRHYVLDHVTGVLTFGDGQRGLIPPRGTNNITATYQTGGGAVGNLPTAAIDQIKSSLPGVAAVTNPIAADGGAELETFSQVKARGAQTLRHRDRAVTSSDLEWLAQQASGTRIARTKCLPNLNRDLRVEPGWVTLLIVPQGTEPKLSPSSKLIREVEDYLAERAFVGLVQQTPARLNVIGCGYTQVTVVANIVPREISQAQQIRQQALTALNAFFHPLTGGIKGKGWEFGRDVYVSEIYYLLEQVPGVDHVKSLWLLPNQYQVWLHFKNAPVTTVDLPIGSLVKTTDGRKSVILAAPVPQGTKLDRIAVKGFKEGDRLQISKDAQIGSLDPFPLTITTVVADNNNRTLNLRIKPYETDTFFPGNSLVTTLDKQVYFPLFPLSTKIDVLRLNQIYTAISVQGFITEDRVEIRHPGGAIFVTDLEISQITPIDDIVYLEDNFLIYPGAHQITMVTDTATQGRK